MGTAGFQIAPHQTDGTVCALQTAVMRHRMLAAVFDQRHFLAIKTAAGDITRNRSFRRFRTAVNHGVISALDAVLKNWAASP